MKKCLTDQLQKYIREQWMTGALLWTLNLLTILSSVEGIYKGSLCSLHLLPKTPAWSECSTECPDVQRENGGQGWRVHWPWQETISGEGHKYIISILVYYYHYT